MQLVMFNSTEIFINENLIKPFCGFNIVDFFATIPNVIEINNEISNIEKEHIKQKEQLYHEEEITWHSIELIKQQVKTHLPLPISHLEKNKQTYSEHFHDSMSYSLLAFKASFYFCIHAFIPESFQTNGSNTIFELNDTIKSKISII